MSDTPVTPSTPAAAQSAPPAAETPAPSRAERKEAFIKNAQADKPANAPTLASTAPAAVLETTEPKAKKFVELANEHKRVLERETKLKAREAEVAAKIKDAEIVEAVRKGDFSRLKEIAGDDWYDKATLHTVGQTKPNAPEILADELKKVRAELDELKNPKPKEPTEEEKHEREQRIAQGVQKFSETIAEQIRADTRFEALHGEAPNDVAKEVFTMLDRDFKRAREAKERELRASGVRKEAAYQRSFRETTPPTAQDIEAAAIRLEAAARAQKDLTTKSADGTNVSGNTHQRANQPQQARSKSSGGESETTLNGSQQLTVPVSNAVRSKEQRRKEAAAMLRAGREG